MHKGSMSCQMYVFSLDTARHLGFTVVMIPLVGISRSGFSGSCRGDGGMKVGEEEEGGGGRIIDPCSSLYLLLRCCCHHHLPPKKTPTTAALPFLLSSSSSPSS